MCGIAGYYSSKYTIAQLESMMLTIAHRGPDHSDIYYNRKSKLGLGHARLSIIDLTTKSNQPIHSKCGRYVMTYNGEIYNFKQLAIRFDLLDYVHSDTQLLLYLFIKLREKIVDYIEGMFSFAVFDTQDERLYLFRDCFGIKPLYYINTQDAFAFASEIKALKLLDTSLDIHSKFIEDYFLLGFSGCDRTIYKQIKSLDAGCYMIVSKDKKIEIHRYWNTDYLYKQPVLKDAYKDALVTLDKHLGESVSKRLTSDSSLGLFLSGGVDSSLIAAKAKQYSPNIDTFSVAFKGNNAFDESLYARKVANILDVNHHVFEVDYTDALDYLEELLEHMDQPFVDTSLLPTYILSKAVSKYVKVALSGDGADELFYGYGTYNWMNRFRHPLIRMNRPWLKQVLKLGSNRYKRVAQMLDVNTSKISIVEHIFSQEQYMFNHKEVDKLIGFPISRNRNFLFEGYRQMSYFEIENYLKHDLLVKVDMASMKTGLEVRVPFLDKELVKFVTSLPDNYKKQGLEGKRILKQLLEQHIPKSLVYRKKQGFSIPLASWMKKELKHLVDYYSSDEMLDANNYINKPYVKCLKKAFYSGNDYLYNRLWQVVVFNKFMHKNNYLK